MRFASDRLALDLGGELRGPATTGTAAPMLEGIAIDSRSLVPGQLFVAVTDVRDGHDFVPAARAAGAPVVLVERPVDEGWSIVVPDVPQALVRIAGLARRRLPEFVVGITGSVGKTTTKDLLAAVLTERFSTAASPQSFNNELGLPLTLANAAEDTEAVVLEMGARGHGHISRLCSMAHPTVGVVTTVKAVHSEHMGGEDQIAVAKRELVEHLGPGGLAVLHAGDRRVAAMAAHTRAEVLTFGAGTDDRELGDVYAEGIGLDEQLRASFGLCSPWGSASVHLGARGIHNVPNALAAAAVGLWAGIGVETVAAGLAKSPDSAWRMELTRTPGGITVLNDAYNAGPASMEAALRSLAALDAQRRVAVLGLMAELGERESEEHRRVAALAEELGVTILAVGTELYGVDPVSDPTAAVAALEATGQLRAGTAVLVKGSRVVGLEEVARLLLDR